ncbi:MAG: hypothetical protein A2X13_06410 [Bacteroidetes bacterium GWC2_33_15]|nr:MAG: hypothetical protein A2X10_09980 [Bacteroidetes bacterium GWA2_33_15]OFX51578.1 MAG: hypothetical protein A2X13_06410 [Bacteroidetes bacterium GWC2_33_15]OFX63353.1 MAG: hypothetical protein A2X15_13955 [Bacteroidetes bacterium GWB2_32_14]OFX68048.1 MAG: hypothetical protein A2X14_08515 [Bacteroidetes bacterium GWD2_33_33]HAN17129.1 hypothetical protein [Bacteroidales bacterium]
MEKITSSTDIKKAIEILQSEQAIKGKLLKEQIYITYESLKPINLLKNTIKDISSSPFVIENIIGIATGITSGYLSKKIVVGSSSGILRNILGSVLQYSVTNAVAQHPEAIKSFGRFIVDLLFRKKNENDPEQKE